MFIDIDRLINTFNVDVKGIIHFQFGMDSLMDIYYPYRTNALLFVPIWGHYLIIKNRLKELIETNNIIVENLGLSNINSNLKVNISSGDDGNLSSFLRPLRILIDNEDINYFDKEEIKVIRLDDYFNTNNEVNYNFLILQSNGTELEILRSSENILNNINYIYINVYIEECFENCSMLDPLDSFLIERGFERVDLQWYSFSWGAAFYIKNN